MTTLTINNLSLKRKNDILINDFSAHISSSYIYSLIGNNGTGKTTLLKTLAGLLPIFPEKIFIDENDISNLSLKDRSQNISFLLQQSPFDPFCLGIDRIAHGLIPFSGFFEDPYLEDQNALKYIVNKLNIYHLLQKPLMNMSGGEQRLVYLAKCLLNHNAKIYLLDEPTVFLDFGQKNNLIKALRHLLEQKKLIIFSSHDQAFIDEIATAHIYIENKKAYIKN